MTKRKKRKNCRPYPFEFRLKAVKLHLEEGYSRQILHEEFGIGKSTLTKWIKNYNLFGEDGLKPKRKPRTTATVRSKIKPAAVKIKQDNPGFGQRRIRDLLKRFFFIKTSPKTVGKALSEEGLNQPQKKKRKKNPQKPRFFERATPNQMWQSDIMTFRLAGKNAYLIVSFLTLFAVSKMEAQADETWSVEECIEYAIEHSLAVELAQVNLEGTEVNLKQARHARWPSLNASSRGGINLGRVINPSTNTFETDDSYFNSFGASSSVPLFAGMQINNSIKQAQINEEASIEDLKQTRVDLAFRVSTAFLDVLFAQENLRNADAKLELSEAQLEQVDKLIAAGSRPENERYDILAQISLDEQDVVRFRNEIVRTELVLKQLMRLEPNYPLALDRPDFAQDLLGRIDTYSFDVIYEKALETQPQIRAQQLRIQSAEINEKITKGQYWPTVSLSGSVGTNWTNLDKFPTGFTPAIQSTDVTVQGDIFPDPVDVTISQEFEQPTEFDVTPYGTQLDNNFGYGFGLNLNIPIYNNYQTKASVDRAKLGILREINTDEQIKQNLKTEIQNALASAQAARESYEASRAALEAAEIAYQNSEKRFDLGAINSYDLINARNRLDQSRVNLTISRFDYVFRILVIEYYLGSGLKYE